MNGYYWYCVYIVHVYDYNFPMKNLLFINHMEWLIIHFSEGMGWMYYYKGPFNFQTNWNTFVFTDFFDKVHVWEMLQFLEIQYSHDAS